MTSASSRPSCKLCDAPAYCKGWCRPHYNRWYRTGDPVPKPKTTSDRYLEKVATAGPDDCWLWTGGLNQWGYGVIYAEGKSWLAHRLGYVLQVGELRPRVCVLHRCDNPPCQNPRHWFAGTQADNNADMFAKGRNKLPPPPPAGNFRRYGIRDTEWRDA